MHSANWWMMALSFVLGLLLTLALMVRRVTREVPVSRAAVTPSDVNKPEVKKPEVKNLDAKAPDAQPTVAVAKGKEPKAPVVVVEPVIERSADVTASTVTVVREDHSDGDATMVIVGGDTVPPDAAIRFVSSDSD